MPGMVPGGVIAEINRFGDLLKILADKETPALIAELRAAANESVAAEEAANKARGKAAKTLADAQAAMQDLADQRAKIDALRTSAEAAAKENDRRARDIAEQRAQLERDRQAHEAVKTA